MVNRSIQLNTIKSPAGKFTTCLPTRGLFLYWWRPELSSNACLASIFLCAGSGSGSVDATLMVLRSRRFKGTVQGIMVPYLEHPANMLPFVTIDEQTAPALFFTKKFSPFLICGLVGSEGRTGRGKPAQATKQNYPGAMSDDLTTPQPFRLTARLKWESLQDAGIRNYQDLRIIQTCLADRPRQT